MQRPVVLHAPRNRRLNTIGFGNIGMHEDGVAAGLRDNLRGLFPCRDIHFRDDNARALGCHFLRGGSADAGTGPGDQRNFTCQTCHYRLNSRVISSIPLTVSGNIRPSIRSFNIVIDRTWPQLCFGVGFSHAARR